MTPVTKFKDRKAAIGRIWKALQSLDASASEATHDEPAPVIEVPYEAEIECAVTETPAEATEPEPAEPETPMQAEEPATSESLDTNVAAPAAPQSPDVAPQEPAANKKATRAKKEPKAATEAGAPREGGKTSQVIATLKREGGTTLEEIMTAMGWQKHTTRAMLSAGGSLTMNHGLTVISEKVGEHRRYSIKG